MPKAAEYPKMVRAGSVAVAVYRVRHKTTSSGWAYTVAWTFAGQRKLRQFGKESHALKEARRVAAKLAHAEAELAEVSKGGDYEELSAARQLAGDVPILAALEEWAKARQICGGQLIPAAEGPGCPPRHQHRYHPGARRRHAIHGREGEGRGRRHQFLPKNPTEPHPGAG